MGLEKAQLQRLADDLYKVRAEGNLIEQPTVKFPNFTLQDGYAVGSQLVRFRESEGQVKAGKKIGFTNQTIWPSLGLSHPIWSTLYRNTIRQGTELSIKGMASPRIEPEIVFSLSRDLVGKDLRVEQILEAMEWYALGFEIVDCNFPDWKCTPADAVADFGFHAALFIGQPQPVNSSLGKALQDFELKLFRNGELAGEGEGRNVLGSPALAINWLLEALQQAGTPLLRAGETITTGTLTEALPIKSGEMWRAEVTGLPLPPFELKFV